MFHRILKSNKERSGFIAEDDTDKMKAYFGGRDPVPETIADRAEQLFNDVRNSDEWLECDCHPGVEPPPRLYTALPLALRKMPQNVSGRHSAGCDFQSRAPDHSEIEPVRSLPSGDLTALGPFASANVSSNRDAPSRSEGERLPVLSQIMFRILSHAGANRILPEHGLDNRRSALDVYRSAKTLVIANHEETEICLGDLIVTAPGPNRDLRYLMWLKEKIENWSREAWPNTSRPQGYLLSTVKDFVHNEKQSRYELGMPQWGNKIFTKARPRIFAESRHSDKRSPYICIVVYAIPSGDAKEARGLRCFMQPCYSDTNWMPVDSDKERSTLEALVSVRDAHPSYRLVIEKPLFDLIPPASLGTDKCRPDFVLTSLNKGEKEFAIAIETKGSNKPGYLASKAKTHPIMKDGYFGFIEHDLSKDDRIVEAANTRQFKTNLEAVLASALS